MTSYNAGQTINAGQTSNAGQTVNTGQTSNAGQTTNAGQTQNGDPLVDRALSQLNSANANYNQAALTPQAPATTGQYQGYLNGKHLVQLADGSLLYGDFDSNGYAQTGDRVTVQQARGATPRFKVMPR